MSWISSLLSQYPVDLTLKPTTFDLWHVCLAGSVVVMSLFALILLIILGMVNRRPTTEMTPQPVDPVIKVVEKIVEVEKIVQAPIPDPVILKEYSPDAALQVLGILQKDARFIDFIKEDVTAYSDAEVGAAARVVHEGCSKALKEHFSLAPVRSEQEGSRLTLQAGFDATANRLTGNIVGNAPFTGTLVHKGWQAVEVRLPKLTQGHNPTILAAAEIEL